MSKRKEPCETGIVRATRDLRPSHFSFKIKSYSILENTNLEKYDSGLFEAGDYKWRLSLYPNGDKRRSGDGYISLYLTIADTNGLPLGWEVNVNFRFFVYDHIHDKYLIIQDSEGLVRRFHEMNHECGFPQLLPLATFKDASNGYLFDDCCVFGAEVFVLKCTFKHECFSIVELLDNGTFTWKINKFSTLVDGYNDSEVFTVGGRQWKLSVYPKGNNAEKGKCLSLFLCLIDPREQKVYADFCFRIKDQINGKHFKREDSLLTPHWFSCLSNDWGYDDLISLEDLYDKHKGFIKNDALIVEVEFNAVSFVN